MERHVTHARRRRWADVAIILASVYALLAAAWTPPELFSGGEGTEVGQPAWLSIAYMAGGMVGILSLFVGQKHTLAGRIMAGLAGLIVLSGLLAMRELTTLSVLSLGGSGVLLLLAAPFMGEMPSPQEERMERHAR